MRGELFTGVGTRLRGLERNLSRMLDIGKRSEMINVENEARTVEK
jgi:hypothetical protein